MTENKKSFVLYADLIHTVRKMPKEKVADLFLHILAFVNDENPIADDLITDLVFEPIKQQFNRDLKKYESVAERNRINGKKGGRPEKEPKKTSGLNENPTEPKKADNDNDTVTDTVNAKQNNNLSVNWEGLLSQFNEITGKKAIVINDKARRQIKARLKEGYTKTNIVDAITNCKNDIFHRETGLKYLTLEFISRPDKMEKYATMKSG